MTTEFDFKTIQISLLDFNKASLMAFRKIPGSSGITVMMQ